MLVQKILEKFKQLKSNTRGSMLVFVMVFGSISFTIIVMGIIGYALFEHRASTRIYNRDTAFHIAEAGVNYYRWHLAHNQTDYTDGTGLEGPYQHEYRDKDGNLVGYFSLEIDDPLSGSSVVTVRSTGWTTTQPESTRTLQVRLGFPSLTDYVFLQNANMNFSFTSEVHGAVHSNGGIRFDGTTDSWVTSAKDKYKYLNQTHDGVWGGGGPKSFWQFPVPAVDFDSVSADLASVQDAAVESDRNFSHSGDEGWHMVFDGTSFDLYRVTSRDCYYGEGRWKGNWKYWYWDGDVYCYDIGNETYVDTYTIPDNGSVFVEDNVWVDGMVDGRVTIGVGTFPIPGTMYNAFINDDIVYNEQSSDDVFGIISQGDIIIPYESPVDMEINAALLSQYGSIYTPNYDPDENQNGLKSSLTFFGSQISYEGSGFKYTNGWGNVTSGFEDTYYVYDGNLKYYPPPGFPVESTYELISWEEIE